MICASRLIQRPPLSLLEVPTIAQSFCTLITYFVWWSKPLNVAVPTVLRGKEAQQVCALLTWEDSEYDEALEMARVMAAGRPSTGRQEEDRHRRSECTAAPSPEPRETTSQASPRRLSPVNERFRGSRRSWAGGNSTNECIAMSISCVFYRLVHFLASNDPFPTPLGRLLWRVSSVVVTCSGLVVALSEWFDKTCSCCWGIDSIIMKLVGLVYISASGFLLGDGFRQLFFLDPAAYQLPSCSNYWPHIP